MEMEDIEKVEEVKEEIEEIKEEEPSVDVAHLEELVTTLDDRINEVIDVMKAFMATYAPVVHKEDKEDEKPSDYQGLSDLDYN